MSRSALNPAAAAKLEAERRLKEGISGHKTGLPKKLLELFEAGPDLQQLTELKKRPSKVAVSGIAACTEFFASPGDPEYEPQPEVPRPPSPRSFRNPEMVLQARVDKETKAEKKARIALEKVTQATSKIEEGLKNWDPASDPKAVGDPFKTLFVARLSHALTEKKLRRELEEFGPIKNISLVHNPYKDGKSRGYAFVEFEHKNDMKNAYKMADGKKVEGRRITVDVERGRTVPNWRPRRFGGGKGGESREAKLPKNAPRGAAPVTVNVPLPPLPATRLVERPPPSDRPERSEKAVERPRERERERDKVEPDKSARKERDRERDRERERDRDANGKTEHDKSRKRERGEEGERDRKRSDKERERDRDGDKDRKRKREKGEREEGEHRSDRKSDRRERDAEPDDRSKRRRERDEA